MLAVVSSENEVSKSLCE